MKTNQSEKKRISVVIVGHVDHGKSTLLGRLLAETGSLPQGKLEQVKALCAKNAKPFEYAFLLDALKDEQEQGITIDAARIFFQTPKRHYAIIDAPGHIEFLKNMVTGAAHAQAALIVIDAKEGIQENTRRHGYLVSMLGLKQVIVVINKMDLIQYDQESFEKTQAEYREFLSRFKLEPLAFIPISAFEGENMIHNSEQMPWYQGNSLLTQFDKLEASSTDELVAAPLRFPLQGVYKFTEEGDERRIFAGTLESGSAQVGDKVIFLPSGKQSQIKSIEEFNRPAATRAQAGQAVGFTLSPQVYVQPGELMVKAKEPQPKVGNRFRANIFWMGRTPLIQGKRYKLKIAAKRVSVKLVEVLSLIDASDTGSIQKKQQLDRHDVAECLLETLKPIAFDLYDEIDSLGRFVLVDDYEIAGGGIIIEDRTGQGDLFSEQIRHREEARVLGWLRQPDREKRQGHKARFILFIGDFSQGKRKMAAATEKLLFEHQANTYFMAYTNLNLGLDSDLAAIASDSDEEVRRLGELARLMTDAGMIFITCLSLQDPYDIELLKQITLPNEIFVVSVGENRWNIPGVSLEVAAHANEGAVAQQIVAALEFKTL